MVGIDSNIFDIGWKVFLFICFIGGVYIGHIEIKKRKLKKIL